MKARICLLYTSSFEPQKRGQAFALYGLVAVLAPSIGPTLGGWITDNFSWRWIFFINIPIGMLAFFLVLSLIHISGSRAASRMMITLSARFEKRPSPCPESWLNISLGEGAPPRPQV